MKTDDVYSILETLICPFLELDDFQNLLMVNKDLYNQEGSWNYFFCERFQHPPTFSVTLNSVKEWKLKNKYDRKTGNFHLAKRNFRIHSKTLQRTMNPIMDYFFPKFSCEDTNEKQIFITKNQSLHEWDGYYFEIYFPFMIHQESIQIGFCSIDTCHENLSLLGWSKDSIGFHVDDSNVYYNAQKLHMKAVRREEKEFFFLGAGIDRKNNSFFFTANGKKIFSTKNPLELVETWKPVFFADRNDLKFIFNDGKIPFHFQIKK